MKFLIAILIIVSFSISINAAEADTEAFVHMFPIHSSIPAQEADKEHTIDIVIDKENVRLDFDTNFLKDAFCLDLIVSFPANTSPQEIKLVFDEGLFGNWFAIYSRYSTVSLTDQEAINLDSSFSLLPSLTNNCESTTTEKWDDMEIITIQDENTITFSIPNHHEDTSELVNNLEIHVKGEHYGIDTNNPVAKNVFPYNNQELSSGGEISSFALTGIFSKKTIINRDYFDAKTDFLVYDGDTLVEHKLIDSQTHRIIELPEKENDVIIYGDTVGHNTNLRQLNLSSEQLIRPWYVVVIGNNPVNDVTATTGIICGDRLCSEIERDGGTLHEGSIGWDPEYSPVLDAAFQYWETRIPGLELNQIISTSNSDFNIEWVTNTDDRLGYYSFSPLKVSVPVVYVANEYMENGEIIKLDKNYVTQLLTHEIGHALGFEHILDDEDVMFAYIYNFGDWQKTSKIYNPTECNDCLRFISPENIKQKVAIPEWIKNNAGWWAEGSIDDNSFVQGIQYMIEEKIIIISDLPKVSGTSEDKIPDWIKNNAKWWADGAIDESDFVNGLKYMVEKGIIGVD